MRIVITGSHGVGKSTLCRQILSELTGRTITKEDMMKVAITGAHGTGKSTLSKLASGKLGYRFIPEAAFEAYQAGFKLNENTGLEAELWILSRQIEQEIRAGDNWVSDRCLIDTLAYARHFLPDKGAFVEMMAEIALPYIRKYDLVIYLPAGQFPIEDDGHRSLDPNFQNQIDAALRRILIRFRIPHYRVDGTPEQRLEMIKSIIKAAQT